MALTKKQLIKRVLEYPDATQDFSMSFLRRMPNALLVEYISILEFKHTPLTLPQLIDKIAYYFHFPIDNDFNSSLLLGGLQLMLKTLRHTDIEKFAREYKPSL